MKTPVQYLEDQIRAHYQQEFGEPSSAAEIWSNIAGRLPAQAQPLTARRRRRLAFAPSRLVRVERRVSAVAALLVVTVLVASVFALFSLRHAASPNSPTGNSAPSPVSPAGTVYTVSSLTGTVYAIDPESGRIIWSTPLHMTPDLPFLVSNGTIFLTSSCIHSTCDLYALRAGDGHLLWQRSYHNLLGNSGATSLTRYLASDGQALYIGSDTGIYAWRASDGQQLWHHALPPACLATLGACQVDVGTVSNGLVYVYFNGLYALNATDGSTRWSNLQTTYAADVGGAPEAGGYSLVVTHNHIYVPDYGGSQTVHVLQADTGKLLDMSGLPQGLPDVIITDGSAVYIRTVPAAGGGADFYALRAEDSYLLWHQHDAQPVHLETVSAGSLYYSYMSLTAASTFVSGDGPVGTFGTGLFHVCARRTTNGSLQWCQSLGTGTPTAAASQGIVYVPEANGLVAMRLSDGTILWHILAHINLDNADTVLV